MPEALNKSSGITVALGDVVRVSDQRSNDPEADGFERCVGLEHLEPGELKTRSWAEITDGTTFTNVFRPGQVLFGKRRAYQRKVAVADFSGVCSGDIYVLEPKDDRLLREFLPFICESEPFYDYVISMSQGGLSPRVNWQALSKYEFTLPPLEAQRRMVRVLSATSELDACFRNLLERQSLLMASMATHLMCPVGSSRLDADHPPSKKWPVVAAEDLASLLVTKGATPRSELRQDDTGVPFIKVYNLTFEGRLDFSISPTFLTSKGHAANSRSQVLPGDVLMNIVGPPLGKLAMVPNGFPSSNINQAIVRYRCKTPEDAHWLLFYLRSANAKRWLFERSKKTSGQRNLTLALCRELPVPMPPAAKRREILEQLARADRCREKIKARRQSATAFRNNLLSRLMTRHTY